MVFQQSKSKIKKLNSVNTNQWEMHDIQEVNLKWSYPNYKSCFWFLATPPWAFLSATCAEHGIYPESYECSRQISDLLGTDFGHENKDDGSKTSPTFLLCTLAVTPSELDFLLKGAKQPRLSISNTPAATLLSCLEEKHWVSRGRSSLSTPSLFW